MRHIALIIVSGLVIATIYYGFREMQKVHIRLDHMQKIIERIQDTHDDQRDKIEIQRISELKSQQSNIPAQPSNNSRPSPSQSNNPTSTTNQVKDSSQSNNEAKPISKEPITKTQISPKPKWDIQGALQFWKGYSEGDASFQPALAFVFKVFCIEEHEGEPIQEPILLKEDLIKLLTSIGQCSEVDITGDEIDILFNQFDRNQSGAIEFSDFMYTMALRRQKNIGLDSPPPILKETSSIQPVEYSSDDDSCEIDQSSLDNTIPKEIQEKIHNLHPIPTVHRDENEIDSMSDSDGEDGDVSSIHSQDSSPSYEIEENQPVIKESQPVAVESQPVVEESQPVVEESQPVVAESQPVVEESQPVVEESQPVVAESQPVVEESPHKLDEKCENINSDDDSESISDHDSSDSTEEIMIIESDHASSEGYTNVFLESLTVKELKELAKKKSIPTNKRRKNELITMIMGSSA